MSIPDAVSSSFSAKWSGFFTECTFDQQREKETANSFQGQKVFYVQLKLVKTCAVDGYGCRVGRTVIEKQ